MTSSRTSIEKWIMWNKKMIHESKLNIMSQCQLHTHTVCAHTDTIMTKGGGRTLFKKEIRS